MRILLSCLLLALLTYTGCATKKNAATPDVAMNNSDVAPRDDANSVAVDATSGIDLTSYLRRIPGMQVRGSGPTAAIRIRDNRSAQSDTTPLFVVNGVILGNNFAQLYSAIDPNEIARVTVLKSASETNRYGLQGGNGVVEIKLKK